MTAHHSKPTTLTSSAQRWHAIRTRDPTFDGLFWYSVRTTGIYCRPSCPSRLPRLDNVQFYASWAAAERAGFRACLRCRPADASMTERQANWVAAACRSLEESPEPLALDELAKQAGVSRFHFHRVFKSLTGVTPKRYADAARSSRVRHELLRAESVTAALYEAGFSSSGRFYARAREILGMAPRDFRSGGRGARIRYALSDCWLGAILVASSQHGICSVALGDDPNALVRELRQQFPHAELTPGDREFARLVARVIASVGACDLSRDLPLGIRGTAFQERVWQALREIPPGSTATYQEIARRLGRPTAARAVAQACASNRLAVLIPCHRVVRSDGSLSGYRWGVARKRALLEREAAASAAKTPKRIRRS